MSDDVPTYEDEYVETLSASTGYRAALMVAVEIVGQLQRENARLRARLFDSEDQVRVLMGLPSLSRANTSDADDTQSLGDSVDEFDRFDDGGDEP